MAVNKNQKKISKLVQRLCQLRYDLYQAGFTKTALAMDKVIDLVGWEKLTLKGDEK